MFDDLIAKPRPKRWKSAVIVGSALVHAGALTAVVVAAMWHVEKLDVADEMDITYRVPAPQGASAPPPAAAKLPTRTETKIVKIKIDVPTQPPVTKEPDPVTTGASTTTDPTGGKDGPGGDGTDPDADPASTGTCVDGPCIDGSDGDPPKPDPEPVIVEKKKPPILPPNVAKGLRVGGNDQIHPPEMVRVDMMHQHKDVISATLQLCVGTNGRVESTRVMKSTGFKSYDDKIVGEVRDWQYKPYRVDGVASPMCTVTMFVYRMRK